MEKIPGKREQNKARKRSQIVEIATRFFFEQGYAATSMSAIAEELGGSKATLWAHFGSKEELFAAVIDLQVETFARDVKEVLTGQTFSIAVTRRACLRFLDCLLRENSVLLFRLVLGEGERFPEITEMFYSRGPARIRQSIATFFATRFPAEQAERLMRLTMVAIVGYRSDILLRPDPPGPQDKENFVNDLVDIVIVPAAREAGII